VTKFGQTGSDDRRAEDDVRDGGDGSQIAYQVLGDGPLDLVFLTGSLSHVDVRWEHPPSARARERMASFSRFICFDRRGVGASDRLPDDAIPTWQEWSDDLGVVLDAVGSESAEPQTEARWRSPSSEVSEVLSRFDQLDPFGDGKPFWTLDREHPVFFVRICRRMPTSANGVRAGNRSRCAARWVDVYFSRVSTGVE